MAIAQTNTAVVPATERRRGRLLRREAIYGYLFISPWILGFLIFTAFPMIYGGYLSFTEYDGFTSPEWVGFDNYQRLFSGDDQLVVKSLNNTLWYVVVAVPATLVFGLLLAMLLNQPVKGIALYRTLFYMPSVVPIVASIAVLMWVFHGRFGLVNVLLSEVGINGPAWLTDPNWVKPTLVIWAVWGVGSGMIIYLAGLQAIPDQLYEAAEIDGAGVFPAVLQHHDPDALADDLLQPDRQRHHLLADLHPSAAAQFGRVPEPVHAERRPAQFAPLLRPLRLAKRLRLLPDGVCLGPLLGALPRRPRS